ncbi:uncharacterized protein LOC143229266 [Tachypleus tridentatus]|uniref:uncharacterized protein LOC143229266 n=1 Tax=Tachypleus tridentatus TaxID=6853 RepID=UPI003FD1DED9
MRFLIILLAASLGLSQADYGDPSSFTIPIVYRHHQETIQTLDGKPAVADAAIPAPSEQDPDGDGIVGQAGSDYPVLNEIPDTDFSCKGQLPGYYADVDTGCQVFHFCYGEEFQDSFLCPNGSIFNQETFTCMWWFNVSCSQATSFYGLNAQLYIIPEPDSQTKTELPTSSPTPLLHPVQSVTNQAKNQRDGTRYVLVKVPVSEDGYPHLPGNIAEHLSGLQLAKDHRGNGYGR